MGFERFQGSLQTMRGQLLRRPTANNVPDEFLVIVTERMHTWSTGQLLDLWHSQAGIRFETSPDLDQ